MQPEPVPIHPMDRKVLDFVEYLKPKVSGRIIFAKVWGSHSHNTDLPTSDIDYLAVYTAPLEELLGIYQPVETVDGKKPDFQAHEAGKFCNLILKGNPGVIECLFTNKYLTMAPPFEQLYMNRKRFLSKRVVDQYVGYARGQLSKLKKGTSLHTKGGEFSPKWQYHFHRLLYDAKRIASGEDPLVWKDTGSDEHTYLMKIRNGDVSQRDTDAFGDVMIPAIDEIKNKSNLPDEGDKDFLNKWLIDLRLDRSQSPNMSGICCP